MNDTHVNARTAGCLENPLNVQQSVLAHPSGLSLWSAKSEHCQLGWHVDLLFSARLPEQALPGGLALWQRLLAAPILQVTQQEFCPIRILQWSRVCAIFPRAPWGRI